jgi:aspartate kinase
MKVYKFGGGVLVNAETIIRLKHIVNDFPSSEKLIIVVSALAKNTNRLEEIAELIFNKRSADVALKGFIDFHRNIAIGLNILEKVEEKLEVIKQGILEVKSSDFNFLYDQIVPFGEIISTFMVSKFLEISGIDNTWLDARKIIKTNRNFRNAKVDLVQTRQNLETEISRSDKNIFILQGFIGHDEEGNSTTLGREGSDYTAAFVSNLLEADELIIWKDVKGIYNADPKIYDKAMLISEMSYNDANELTSFGAKVLHHKSVLPLQQKKIDLRVKYFFGPNYKGTIINESEDQLASYPVIVTKRRQKLIYSKRQNLDFVEGLIQNYGLELSLKIKTDKSYYVVGGNHELMNEFLSEILEFDGVHILDVSLIKIKNCDDKIIRDLKERYPVEFMFEKDNVTYLVFT